GFEDRPIHILKIDVEGCEPGVIAGAKRALARTAVVISEFSPTLSRAGGLSPEEMLASLDAAGFKPFGLGLRTALNRLQLEPLRQSQGQRDIIWMKASE